MRLLKQELFYLLIFLAPSLGAAAADLDYRTEHNEIKSFITFGLENSQFDVNNAKITGFGGKLDFTHFMKNNLSFQVFISSAINQQNSVSSSFTGLGGYVFYSVLGACCQTKKFTTVSGTPVISETRPEENILNVGIGIDQYMLYGTSSVYPASGLGYAAQYLFGLFGRRFKAEARMSNLSLGSTQIKGLSLGVGIVLPL